MTLECPLCPPFLCLFKLLKKTWLLCYFSWTGQMDTFHRVKLQYWNSCGLKIFTLFVRLGPQQNQGKWVYREAEFTEWSCVCPLPPDQEEAPAWQRQSGPGEERDSCSCLWMGLTGTGSGACWADLVQRGSREMFLVLFGNGKQEHDLIKMYLFFSILEVK